jgi:hypothetical protein
MNSLNEIALQALKRGSDYFGEKIVGVKDKVYYYESQKYYTKIVMLENPDGSPCSSEIGIYLHESDSQDHNGVRMEEMYVVSGHKVFRGLKVTSSIKKELENAERIPL